MSYLINKTDGTLLIEVVDGTVDQVSTDITLIGKNATSYGEFINENFVRMLENFAGYKTPSNPIQGQIWYDTLENRLKVYDNTSFKLIGGTIVSDTVPSSIAQGDIWIDSRYKQLYFNDGESTVLVGPIALYDDAGLPISAVTGYKVLVVEDVYGNSQTVMVLSVLNSVIGVFSATAFTLNDSSIIVGYDSKIVNIGINFSNVSSITNVIDPTEDLDVVNKQTLDRSIKLAPLAISLNITDFVDKHDEISAMLDKIFPADEHAVASMPGPICRVVCTDDTTVIVKEFQLLSSIWEWVKDL